MIRQREQMTFLCAIGADTEVRAHFDDDTGDLVVWWFDKDPKTGEWSWDQGARIPKRGVAALAELAMEKV